MEVIYTGLRQTPEDIVEAAIQEDVDAIGLSCLSGAHMTLFPEVVKLLKKRKSGDILVAGGGIIPEEDIPEGRHQGRVRPWDAAPGNRRLLRDRGRRGVSGCRPGRGPRRVRGTRSLASSIPS